ncbi:hypothetical protein [Novosphingobium sp. ST904]|uniref:hypothetical protein n=1 Tax=Novosphingobium sp. ST904 TaxID=1684385 RepID=UPI0006C84D5F|nr:hypothetical protein [Novosphingobium sp. ST904]KPH67541.1 hypothetical protein ADT71_02245 [Novosphingobium sp. ST904]TCM30046.1 hypothetical protein EDF59_12773 [Novosphingobium sp. ST904]
MHLDVETMRKGMTAAPADLPRIETQITNAEKRLARAKAKLAVAEAELSDAETWLQRCVDARTDWVEGRTQPQMMMF